MNAPQHTESSAGGRAEGAGQSANTNSPAPLSAASEAAVRGIMWKLHHEADWLPEDVELLIRAAIDAAVRVEREACAVLAQACRNTDYPVTGALYWARIEDCIRARGER